MSMESQQGIEQPSWGLLKCPFCRVLFRVDKKDLSRQTSQSFSCLSCRKIFWAKMNADQSIQIALSDPQAAEVQAKEAQAHLDDQKIRQKLERIEEALFPKKKKYFSSYAEGWLHSLIFVFFAGLLIVFIWMLG